MINTILIADDSALDNAIVRNFLYKERYNLISALNGREALESIDSRNIDLILLDLVMPVMNGHEFLTIFSKTPYYKEIPIIITSALDDLEAIDKILQYDIFDFIVKPLNNVNKYIMINKIKAGIRYRNNLLQLNRAKKLLERNNIEFP